MGNARNDKVTLGRNVTLVSKTKKESCVRGKEASIDFRGWDSRDSDGGRERKCRGFTLSNGISNVSTPLDEVLGGLLFDVRMGTNPTR